MKIPFLRYHFLIGHDIFSGLFRNHHYEEFDKRIITNVLIICVPLDINTMTLKRNTFSM